MCSKMDYVDLYVCLKDYLFFVLCEMGMLLYMFVCSGGVMVIVEFGMLFGILMLYFVVVLCDNGGGWLIMSEFELLKVVCV